MGGKIYFKSVWMHSCVLNDVVRTFMCHTALADIWSEHNSQVGFCNSAFHCVLESELGFTAEHAAVEQSCLWGIGASKQIHSQKHHAMWVCQWKYSLCVIIVFVSAHNH